MARPTGSRASRMELLFVHLILFLEVLFYFIILFAIGINASQSRLALAVGLNF